MKTGNMIWGVAAAAFMAGSTAATAEEPTYSYIEGGAGYAQVDTPGGKGDGGYWAGFSARLADKLYINGRYGRYDLARYSIHAAGEFELGQLNFGYRLPIGEHSDFNAEIGFDQFDISDSAGARDDDGSGARASVGVRLRSGSRVDSRIYLGYTQAQQDVFLGVEGSFPLTQRLGFTLQFESYEGDRNLLRGGLRLGF
ncbi:hypothetical protein [Wenzhouxiangella sp. EGI_FJ10409]|uniref:hypothetical protein n=1 Tax=Wenzhouxiangella sp. EGI_FJ10409 TaxID=3243767 RepID=UPI0035DF76CB